MEKLTKSGISPIPVERYSITSTDVADYLQNKVLGFSIGCDFARWTGVSPDYGYVRMRAAIAPGNIIASSSDNDYVSKVLAATASGMVFKEDVINSLKPFMFPNNMIALKNQPEELQRLYQVGIIGDRLDEIIQNSKLSYSETAKFFRVYLRPERIITDMLTNPDTGKIDGDMSIVGIHGVTSETIRWDVIVSSPSASGFNGNISIDSIFNRKN